MAKRKRQRRIANASAAALYAALAEGRLQGVGVAERYGAYVNDSPTRGRSGGFRPKRQKMRMVVLGQFNATDVAQKGTAE